MYMYVNIILVDVNFYQLALKMPRVDTKQPIISQETLLTPAAFHCDDSFLTLFLAEEQPVKI
jgi:hypothetical protein